MRIFLKVVAFLCVYLLPTSTNLIMAEDLESKVLQANGAFSQKLYQILARNSGNLIFSPISVHTVLAMASQGAGGTTKDAFLLTLNIPDNDVASKGYNRIIRRLNTVRLVTVALANKIYIKNRYTLQSAFKNVIVRKFLSDVESINFAKSNAAASNINKWVREKTNNKIDNLVTPNDLDQYTRLVLLNAIYFKGATVTYYSLNPHSNTFIADHPFVFKLTFAVAKNKTAVELFTGIYKEN